MTEASDSDVYVDFLKYLHFKWNFITGRLFLSAFSQTPRFKIYRAITKIQSSLISIIFALKIEWSFTSVKDMFLPILPGKPLNGGEYDGVKKIDLSTFFNSCIVFST